IRASAAAEPPPHAPGGPVRRAFFHAACEGHLTGAKCIDVVIHMDATLLHIQPAAAQPIYRQIAEQIRRLVAGGQLAAGTTLPSVRDVAAAHAINPMTVSKAYSQLEAEGVLERQRGKGMAVASGAAAPPSPQQ